MEGTWWYNQGRSHYQIFAVAGSLSYYQQLGEGRELYGELKGIADPSGTWAKEAALSNGARIRFRLDGAQLVTSYQRAGTVEWRTPLVAQRGPSPQGEAKESGRGQQEQRQGEDGGWYSQEQFAKFYGGTRQWESASAAPLAMGRPKAKGGPGPRARGPPPPWVEARCIASQIRQAALAAFTCDDVDDDAPLTNGLTARQALQRAIPTAHLQGVSPLDRRTPMLLVERVSRDALDEYRAKEKVKAQKGNPKTTISPVPAVSFGIGLVHPVSYNEEQMLRLFIGDPRNLAYNLAAAFRSHVALDAKSAARTHLIIIERHDVLRSAYKQDDPMNPLRTVSRELPGGVRTLVAATEADAQRLQGMDQGTAHQIGVVGMRCSVALAHSNDCPNLGVNLHHILTDADGMHLYLHEMWQIQTLLSAGFSEEAVRGALPKLPVQFIDFAYWQKSLESQGLLDSDLAYWYSEVVSSSPPVILDVPLDKPRPRFFMAVGASQRCIYENELLLPLSEVSGRATPMAVTCTNFAIVLSRLTGTPVLDVAIPFALRNMPALMNLIGNFLNMMPVRMTHDPSEPYSTTLSRIATSNINVQKYSLGAFIQLVNQTRKHYPITDPSRNPIYATMIDLVPNESNDPSTALSGVLDVFLFVNTRQGAIWSLDAVYNTTILEEQTVRAMLLQMPAMARQAARSGREPVPRALPHCEEAQPSESAQVDLTSLIVRVGVLPHVVSVSSGVEVPGAAPEYHGIRQAARLKRHSGLELMADCPPAALQARAPPGPPVLDQREQAAERRAPALAPGRRSGTQALVPAGAERAARRKRSGPQTAASKARSYELAARSAETQRVSELISLDGDWFPPALAQEPPEDTEDWQLLQRGRQHSRSAAGRGRAK